MNTHRWKHVGLLIIAALAASQAFADPNVIQEHYRWRNDDGGETTPPPPGGASWKQNLDAPLTGQVQNDPIRLRFSLSNSGDGDSTAFKPVLQYSPSKFSGYQDVPVSLAASPGAPFVMADATGYANGAAASTDLLPGSEVTYQAGTCVEFPTNSAAALNFTQSRHINFEYCFEATTNSVGGMKYYFRIADNGWDLNAYEPESYAELTVIAPPVVGNDAGASALTPSSATLNGVIQSTGGDTPTAKVYWGPTDGTTNKTGSGPGAWSNEVDRGSQSGAFSTSISSLTANKQYFYRCYATNAAGEAWASATTNFTTTAPFIEFTDTPYLVLEDDGTATLTLSIENASATTVTVFYATSNGTAVSGSDYGATSGVVQWNPGDGATKDITVPLTNDGTPESSEQFHVALSSPTNCNINGASQTTVTIIDDDGNPSVDYALASATGDESLGSTSIVITLSKATTFDVTVDYYVAGGTAALTSDYLFTNGTATIESNTLSTTVTLHVVDDDEYEDAETVILGVSNAVNAFIGFTSNHTFTITDTDPRAAAVNNNNGAANIQASQATLRGEVTDSGRDDPQVMIYWGPTDGTTNKPGAGPGAWSNTVDAGVLGIGIFSEPVLGLSSGVVYYYRCYVTNAGGEAWATASETFTANDPPTFQLLANVSLEDAGTPAEDAEHWTRSSSSFIERTNAFARTLTYSFQFEQSANRYINGTGENKFRCTWNGQYSGGGVHPDGGVRPGFIAGGTAHTRAQTSGSDPANFEYRLHMVNSGIAWTSGQLEHSNIVYQAIAISNVNPLGTAQVTEDFRPAVIRLSQDGGEGAYHCDDLSMTMGLPKLVLDRDPTNLVTFTDTPAGLSRDLDFGARSQGGSSGTVLYGAYITNNIDLASAAWGNKAWHVSYDPGNAFSVVPGTEALTSTNDGPWQYATLRFTPPAAGSYTAIVHIATTDPNDNYDGGGTIKGSINYERYVVEGTGITPPTVSINNISTPEGNSGSSVANFTLTLSEATIGDVTVQCTTSNGSAVAASDYTGFAGQVVTIDAGDTSTNLQVTILGDTDPEANELFYVDLSLPTNATLGTAQGTCTIQNDDGVAGDPLGAMFLFR